MGAALAACGVLVEQLKLKKAFQKRRFIAKNVKKERVYERKTYYSAY